MFTWKLTLSAVLRLHGNDWSRLDFFLRVIDGGQCAFSGEGNCRQDCKAYEDQEDNCQAQSEKSCMAMGEKNYWSRLSALIQLDLASGCGVAVPSFLVVMFDFPVHPNSASIGFELDVDRNNVAVSARCLLPCRAICSHAITGEFFCWVKVVMSPWEGRGTSCFFFFAKERGAPVVWLRKASGINFMLMCVAVKTFHLDVAAVFLGMFPSQRGILIWWGDAVNSQTFVLPIGWFLLHRDGC